MAETLTEKIEDYALSKSDQPKSLFSKVGVVGCGAMGQSISRMISSKGIEVVFLEVSEEAIQTGIDGISMDLDDMIDRWGMTESEKRAILSRIKGTLKYEDFSECDLVIEAILAKTRETSVEVRKDVFRQIEENVSPTAILATNSSTLLITELASELKHKERCISLHFTNTARDAGIIEVANSLYTSDEVYENLKKFVKLINKKSIKIQESPGLISPRLLVSWVNEACAIQMENVASIEDIDLTMRQGFGLPLGPFELADKIGLDRIIRWMDNLYYEFGDSKYKASPVIRRLFRAHHHGRKSGKGFYLYDANGKKLKPAL